MKQHLDKYTGHAFVACADYTPTPASTPSGSTTHQAATANSIVTSDCASSHYSRFEGCQSGDINIDIFQVSPPSPIPVGHLAGTVVDDIFTVNNSLQFTDNVSIHFSQVSGQATTLRLFYRASCTITTPSGSATCSPTPSFPNGVTPTTSNDISATVAVSNTVPTVYDSQGRLAGQTATKLSFGLSFQSTDPNVLLPADITYDTRGSVACDNTASGINPGCVFAGFWPTLNTMKSLPHIAWNIYTIQQGGNSHYGLAGATQVTNGYNPNGNPLTRYEGGDGANRAVACPDSRPNPAPGVVSCDEYPFNATYQGASFAAAGDWGWAWVPVGENNSQGGLIGGFYTTNRVLDGDNYWVDVSGATYQPPVVGAVTIASGITNNGTYASSVAVTASAPPADAFYFHVQQNGADVLVSPSIPGTPGTNNHTWQFDTTTVPNGQYQVYGAAMLGGSLVGVNSSIAITVANAPHVTIDSGLANGGVYAGQPVAVTGTATPGADYFYFHFQQGGVDQLVSPNVPGTPGTPYHTWLFDPYSLPNGQYQVYASATLGGVPGQSSTITITVANSSLFQQHSDGSIWEYRGVPMTGWTQIGNNVATKQVAVSDGGSVAYELDTTGSIWKWTSSGGWTSAPIDTNSATVQIAASDNNNLYQLHSDGSIFGYTPGVNANWTQLGNNVAAVGIAASNDGSLIELDNTGTIWHCVGGSWTMLDNNTAAVGVSIGDTPNSIWQQHSDGSIWQYTGTGWTQVGNNVATSRIVAGPSAGILYELDNTGTIWEYNNGTWTQPDNNTATTAIQVGEDGTLYQFHGDGSIFQYTPGVNANWTRLDNNTATKAVIAGVTRSAHL